jgi:hypothetical protein
VLFGPVRVPCGLETVPEAPETVSGSAVTVSRNRAESHAGVVRVPCAREQARFCLIGAWGLREKVHGPSVRPRRSRERVSGPAAQLPCSIAHLETSRAEPQLRGDREPVRSTNWRGSRGRFRTPLVRMPSAGPERISPSTGVSGALPDIVLSC